MFPTLIARQSLARPTAQPELSPAPSYPRFTNGSMAATYATALRAAFSRTLVNGLSSLVRVFTSVCAREYVISLSVRTSFATKIGSGGPEARPCRLKQHCKNGAAPTHNRRAEPPRRLCNGYSPRKKGNKRRIRTKVDPHKNGEVVGEVEDPKNTREAKCSGIVLVGATVVFSPTW